jgi:hypothetical protein
VGPANDALANATVLAGATPAVSGTTVGATKEQGERSHLGYGAQSVWYAWTAPMTGRATVNLTLGSPWWDATQAVYTGATHASMTQVTSSDGGVMSFAAVERVTYRLVVDGWSPSYEGPFDLSLKVAPTPANDRFVDATVLTGSSDDVTGTTAGAAREDNEADHAGLYGTGSVWYRWRAPASGPVTLETVDTDVDTLLAVYTGTSPRYYDVTSVAANNDSGGTTRSRVTFGATAGTVYRVAVDSRTTAGRFGLRLRHATPPANDAFASATVLSGPVASADGTTVGATGQTSEPRHAGVLGGASVWYAWTAPANGSLRVSTTGSAFNTLLAAYTGDALASLTPVAANDDAGTARTSEVTFPVTKDTTYRIAVDAFNDREGPLQGAAKLALELTPAPAPESKVAEPAVEDPPVQDPPKEDPPVQDPPVQDPPKEDPPVQDPPVQDPPKEDPPVQDPPKVDPPAQDPPTQETPTQDPPKADPPTQDPPKQATPPQDTSTRAVPPSDTEKQADDPPAKVQAAPGVTTARSSTPAPRPPAPGTGPAPAAPLTVGGQGSRLKLAAVARGGLLGNAQCSRSCRLTAVISPASGARGRAASRMVVQALGANADRTRFKLRLTPAARKALRAGRLVVTLTATGADGATATTRHTVTLVR